MVDESCGGEEPCRDAVKAGLGDQCDSEMCFPGSDITVEDEVFTPVEEVECGEVFAGDVGGQTHRGPVIAVEGFAHRDTRAVHQAARSRCGSGFKLRFEELNEDVALAWGGVFDALA